MLIFGFGVIKQFCSLKTEIAGAGAGAGAGEEARSGTSTLVYIYETKYLRA